MRRVSMVMIILVLALAGTAAVAQVCPPATPCPAPIATCPAPAPVCPPAVTCPAPVATCPAPVATCPPVPACPCPVTPAPASPPAACITCSPPSYPAGIGAGPAAGLCNVTGCDFNEAFIQSMYQHHTDTAALATQGIQMAQDKDLRDLSGKIRYEQTKQSQKLSLWQDRNFGGAPLTVNYTRVQADMDRLQQLQGSEYDAAYAQTMILYLQQTNEAAQLGMERLSIGDLRNQAKIVARSSQLEINALQRWLAIHAPQCLGTTCTAPVSCPAAPCPTPAP